MVYVRSKNTNSLGKVSCKETLVHQVLKSEERQVKSMFNPFLLKPPVG